MKIHLASIVSLSAVASILASPSRTQTPQHDSTSSAVAVNCDPKEFARMQAQLQDWAGLQRYRSDDAALVARPVAPKSRVVFYGDSITDAWGRLPDTGWFFPGKDYINRGISGQTTPQMLVRFQQDVVILHPSVVVILAGTNDVAGNTGPSTPEMIEDNYTSMVKIANASGIKVILASITPAYECKWRPSVRPVEVIRQLNIWIRQYCGTGACTYLDYYSAMADANGAMHADLTKDGVHPNAKGYSVMAPLAETAIEDVLRRSGK